MSSDEAARFGIEEGQRRSFVRVDSGKVNITPPLSSAQWFKIVGVPLGNATTANMARVWRENAAQNFTGNAASSCAAI